MKTAYDLWLVALSLLVAALAAYTVLDISGRIALMAAPRQRRAWRTAERWRWASASGRRISSA